MRVTSAIAACALGLAAVLPSASPSARAQSGLATPPALPAPVAGAPVAGPQVAEPPVAGISRECQTPGIRVSGDLPLPQVTKALQSRKIIRILAIGGSRAGGGRASVDGGYQALIEAALERTIPGVDVQMIDRGVSGELAEQASERIKTEVALVRPDLVLWQVGTHDALMHVPVDQIKSTVGTAIDWLKTHEIDVVLVGLHYVRRLARETHYQSVRLALRTVAEEKQILWIRRYDAMQLIDQARRTAAGSSPNEFTQTEHGYECLSEYIVRALVSGAFLRPPRRPPNG